MMNSFMLSRSSDRERSVCRPLISTFLCLALLGVFTSIDARAQERFAFDPDLSYDPAIPSPASELGYELGDRFTFHAHMLDYFEALAEASPLVTLHDYGRTHEGRRLVYAVISSAANQGRIDEIRQNSLRLADPSDTAAAGLMDSQPLIHWMSYNIHGNEPSSTEAAMQVAYRLAAAQDAETRRLLDELVVIIDPCINPDGRDRYAYWYTTMHSKHLNTNPEDAEHSEPWPGGRTNHYWFDLNRDWVWLVHPESQGRIAAYQQWMPQVHIDYHEQGYNNNYFTHPGTTPRNLNLPDDYLTWESRFGQGDAQAFDERQISYFTREVFDFYYPGYGSSYPSVMGGIGMLREQGGGSRGARAVKSNDGYILTLRQRIFDHYLTSFAGMNTSLENRRALLQYFRDALTPALNRKRLERAYYIPDNGNDYTRQFIWMLMEHGVEVERASEAFSVNDARDYWTNQPANRQFEAGTFVVRTEQARSLFVNTILQREMAIEDSIMYDMATWSAPLAYNLNAAWSEREPSVATTRLTEAPAAQGRVENADARYVFVIEWKQRHAAKALALLWEAGYNVRSVSRPLHIGNEEFSRGSLIILLGRNLAKTDSVSADVQRIAEEAGVEIHGYDSGWTPEGINPASPKSISLKKPSVGLLIDTPFNSYTTGQLWFLFEEWTHFPINRLRISDLDRIELKNYDVLLIPGASGNLAGELDSARVAKIKTWVNDGGTLIGTESGARFLTKDESGLTGIELSKSDEEEKEDDEEKSEFEPGTLDDPYVGLEQREDLEDLDNVPGSAVRTLLDATNPLAYGMPERMFGLKFGAHGLEPSTSAEVAGYYHQQADSVLASGYMSIKNREKLAGKAFAMVQRSGRGKVALLLDNTQYRMFWVGPSRLMQNAVMLLPSM